MALRITGYLVALRPDGSMADVLGVETATEDGPARRALFPGVTSAEASTARWVPLSEFPDPGARILAHGGHDCPGCGAFVPCDRDPDGP